MSGNPFYQDLDPASPPDPVTPAGSVSSPEGYAAVTPAGRGPAGYDISAPQDIGGIAGTFSAANDLAGAGVLYPFGPRQQQSRELLDSPQGSGAVSVTAGFPDYEDTDVNPGANMENPIQGAGTYPGTRQDGVPMYGAGDENGPLPGAPPAGSTGPGGLDYPGTTQSGIPTYGT